NPALRHIALRSDIASFPVPPTFTARRSATYTWSCICCRPRDPFICSFHLAMSHQSEAEPNAVSRPSRRRHLLEFRHARIDLVPLLPPHPPAHPLLHL